jgi:hypothetical protein
VLTVEHSREEVQKPFVAKNHGRVSFIWKVGEVHASLPKQRSIVENQSKSYVSVRQVYSLAAKCGGAGPTSGQRGNSKFARRAQWEDGIIRSGIN